MRYVAQQNAPSNSACKPERPSTCGRTVKSSTYQRATALKEIPIKEIETKALVKIAVCSVQLHHSAFEKCAHVIYFPRMFGDSPTKKITVRVIRDGSPDENWIMSSPEERWKPFGR